MKKFGLILAGLIFTALILASAYVLISRQNNLEQYYRVIKVVDGDTIDVDINGAVQRVRLIGIDTPEPAGAGRPAECLADEASARTAELLANQAVRLESDISQGEQDQYGRLLRYVFLPNGDNFNRLMLQEGMAYEYTYQTPYLYQQDFQQAENQAKVSRLGLWAEGVCNH